MIDWRHWHNEPFLIGGLIFFGWLYTLAIGPLRKNLSPGALYPRNHALRFYLGLLVFYLAVGSPLDQVGESFLLSAHMVQHQLLIYGSAVLVLLGLPSWLVAAIVDRRVFPGFFQALFHPVVCGLIYVVVLSVWHAPSLYDWALRSKTVHVIEHLMFFGAALFYWWPLLSPSPRYARAGYGAQMIYLLAVTVAMTPVFAFIAFSDNILYPTYEYAPRLIDGFDPSEDQLLGAVIMKGGSLGVTFLALSLAFYRWYQATERKQAAI